MKGDLPELVAVARVLAPQGNRGEVRVESLTDNPLRLTRPGRFILSRVPDGSPAPDDRSVELISGRPHGRFYVLKFAGSESIADAETLRNLWVKVRRDELLPLPPGSFYLFEIIGCSVVSEDGRPLGRVEEILRGSANDVYVVRGPRGEVLLPATREVILSVDRESRTMIVHPLLEANEGGEAR